MQQAQKRAPWEKQGILARKDALSRPPKGLGTDKPTSMSHTRRFFGWRIYRYHQYDDVLTHHVRHPQWQEEFSPSA